MAVVDDVLVPAGDAHPTSRVVPWRRALAGFAIGFGLCLALAGGAFVVLDAGHEGRVLAGVRVGDVDLSGLDRAAATTALSAAYAGLGEGRVVVRTSTGDVVVPYAAFARRADIDAMVDHAMHAGRTGSPLERAVSEVRLALDGTTLEPRVTFDPAALASAVRDAVKPLRREPVDARILMTGSGIYAIPALSGRWYDDAPAATAALDTVGQVGAPAEVTVEAPGYDLAPQHGDDETTAATAAAGRMIADIKLTFGKKSWPLKASVVRTWIRFETRADGSVWPTTDVAAIAASLPKISKAVRLDPTSAMLLKNGSGRVVGVAASKDGRRLDADGTAKAIAAALADRATEGGAPTVTTVPVRTAAVPPKFSTADALQKGPLMVRLGTWKTWFSVSERNYFGANIWLPAKIIDGTVLQPGQRFEWWRALGPVTPSRGFGPGGFIAGDHTEPTGALGGGMCSSSTTLFNAALRAGLQMGSRANHRYYIDRYPLGLDATVSKTPGGGTQTVSFTNDMKTPIVIRTFRYRANGRGWVRYEIWGIRDGRTVSLSKPALSNVRQATTRTVSVPTLEPGERLQTEYPADGMDVSVTRVVRDRQGRVMHRDTYRSHYALWNGVIEVGR